MQTKRNKRLVRFGNAIACILLPSPILAQGPQRIPSTLAPASTSAHQIFDLSIFVVSITGGIFLVVGGLESQMTKTNSCDQTRSLPSIAYTS